MAHCTVNVCRHHDAPHLLHHGPEYCGKEGPSNLDTAKALIDNKIGLKPSSTVDQSGDVRSNKVGLKPNSTMDQSNDIKKVYLTSNQSNDHKNTQNRSSKDGPLDWSGKALRPVMEAYGPIPVEGSADADGDDDEPFFNNTHQRSETIFQKRKSVTGKLGGNTRAENARN